MRLVIDTNIVISALISREGKASSLLFLSELQLYAPPFLLEEIEEHKSEILEKTELSELNFSIALARITSHICFVPVPDYAPYLLTTKKFSPDPDDLHYLALALSLGCPVWTNDKRLKEQTRVLVLSTHELALKLSGPLP